MTQEKWKEVKSLFEQLIILDDVERENYLDKHCHDQEVFQEVKSLLKSHQEANNFLSEIDSKEQPQIGLGKEEIMPNQQIDDSVDLKSLGGGFESGRKDFSGTSRFLIQKRLGEGGFGVVYQAYDREHNSIVALKTLHQTDAEDLYRFKKEFRGLADVVHTNLAAMYELFSEEDQWFFTMEMIYGADFLDYVKDREIEAKAFKKSFSDLETSSVNLGSSASRGEKTEPDVLRENAKSLSISGQYNTPRCKADIAKLRLALKQLAEGLCALHQANKLHRDLKPSNVLVTREGRVVILDFGLVSELTSQGVNQITSDSIMGTPVYMSPEHISGRPISPASDWYSVGVMLYLALTGELPFQGTPMEILLSKQRRDAMPPSEIVSGIPEDLAELCCSLLKRNPNLRPTGAQVLEILGHPESLSQTPLNNLAKSSTLFVGREKELAKLNQAWQLTKQGKGVTLYVKGLSGMGKSTIIRHFLEKKENNEPDLLIFSGRCYEQESVPYKVIDSIVDLLSKYLRNLSDLEVEALLPLDILTLARLFPVLKQVNAIANTRRNLPDSPDAQELRRKAFSALRELLIRITNKKDLIIFIDDLQWGDNDSVGLLLELIRPPEAPRMLLIGSYRSEEAEKSTFLRTLFSLQNTTKKIEIQEMEVKELSAEDSGKLAIALLGKDIALKQSKAIVKESGGSPFFISELAQYALTKENINDTEIDLSDMTVDQVVSARIDLLPKEGRRLLETIAVSGQPLPRNVAKKAARIASDEQVLPVLRTSHLLRLTGNNTYEEIDTYHDRIREAVLTNLSAEALKNYHYSLALALEGFEKADPERLAKHFQLAGERDKASEYTMTAAEQADQILAFERAAQLYQQSLELKSSQDLTTSSIKIKLGNALSNAGQGAEAARVYLAATKNSTKQGLLRLQHKAAEQFLNSGYVDEGIDLLNEVLKKTKMQLPKTHLEAILSIIIGRIKLWFRGMNYKECKESEVSSEILIPLDICWTVTDSLSTVDTVRAIDFQTKHLHLALKAGEPYRLVRAMAFEGLFFSGLGRLTKSYSVKMVDKASKLAQKVKKPELIAMVEFIKGSNAYLGGNWQQAWDLFCNGEKITLKECRGDNYAFALRGIDNSIVFFLRALLYLGDINQLLLRLSSLLENAKDRNNLLVLTNLKTFISYIQHLVADEPEKAYQELSQINDLWIKKGVYFQQYWRIVAQGETGLYTGKGMLTWQYLQENWPALKKSLLLNIPNIFIEALHLQARVALVASKEASDPKPFLKIAKTNAKKILGKKTVYGDAWAELILASVAASTGSREMAINYLASAEKKFEKTNMALYLAATRRRRGELLEKLNNGENSESKNLIAESDKWMHSQQIKEPARITQMLIPVI